MLNVKDQLHWSTAESRVINSAIVRKLLQSEPAFKRKRVIVQVKNKLIERQKIDRVIYVVFGVLMRRFLNTYIINPPIL